jgi:glyoxylase-like metal-dependent hydrolase (beta-lactamase superfamily II)
MATVAPLQTLTIGTTRVTYLPDGELYMSPANSFPDVAAADWQPYTSMMDADGRLVGSVGAHVIQTDSQTILVDAGNGPHVIDHGMVFVSGGELLDNLKRLGLTPDDIDILFYTHLHIDHVGWTGRIANETHTYTFPHARYLVRSAEWHRFDKRTSTGPFGIAETLRLLAPRIEFIEDGQSLASGITVVAAPGHTIGHAALLIQPLEDGGERLIILGDALHSPVELDHPDWASSLDDDSQQTEQTRRSLLHELAVPSTIGSCIHFPNSAFGRLLPGEDGRYQWQTETSART